MLIQASIDSVTLGEFHNKIGKIIEVSFGIVPAYIGAPSKSAWPCDLSQLGPAALVPIPELGPTMIAVTGTLSKEPWIIHSAIDLRVLTDKANHQLENQALSECQATGSLSIIGKELGGDRASYSNVLLRGFQSICLQSTDPKFGQWIEVNTYSDLKSDPDTTSAPVCIAEIEL